MEISEKIIRTAIKNGATLAGIAGVEALRGSPSHMIYGKMPDAEGAEVVKDFEDIPDNEFVTGDQALRKKPLFDWPDAVKSVLVIGLSHPEDRPELDWWDGRGTPGNRMMIDIIKRTSQEIENGMNIKTRKMHYYVEKGGIFLKDAAVLAGLGCIGKNNMLVTPSVGPRLRLRALFLESEIPPNGIMDFDPCSNCKVYCRRVCPEKAMNETASIFKSVECPHPLPGRDGTYDRALCNIRMKKDIEESTENDLGKQPTIKFCRKCEFVCPVGK